MQGCVAASEQQRQLTDFWRRAGSQKLHATNLWEHVPAFREVKHAEPTQLMLNVTGVKTRSRFHEAACSATETLRGRVAVRPGASESFGTDRQVIAKNAFRTVKVTGAKMIETLLATRSFVAVVAFSASLITPETKFKTAGNVEIGVPQPS